MLYRALLCRSLFAASAILLAAAATASAQWVGAVCAAGGSDYLQTTAANIDLSTSGFGVITLTSNPNFSATGAGNVDTIVQRQEDAVVNGNGSPSVPAQILDLSLTATGVMNTNTFLYNIFVTLDPTNLPLNTGTITINGDASGGTFSTCINVYLLATFVPTNGGPALPPFMPGAACQLGCNQGPFSWTSTIPINAFLVIGPYPAFNANEHTGLPVNYVDFYFAGAAAESCTVAGAAFNQTVQQAPQSETLAGPLAGQWLDLGLDMRR
jgi:hypothetical protein